MLSLGDFVNIDIKGNKEDVKEKWFFFSLFLCVYCDIVLDCVEMSSMHLDIEYIERIGVKRKGC